MGSVGREGGGVLPTYFALRALFVSYYTSTRGGTQDDLEKQLHANRISHSLEQMDLPYLSLSIYPSPLILLKKREEKEEEEEKEEQN